MTVKIAIALGGNALLRRNDRPTYADQYRRVRATAAQIARIAGRYEGLLITHGNGPQVGEELLRNEYARRRLQRLPLYLLNAETQASIGSMLVTALSTEFARRRIRRGIAAVLTHVEVDARGSAFRHPSKPVGPFYTRAELGKALARGRFSYIHEGRMYRRVVPSPEPLSVLEIGAIKSMFDDGTVIIAGGGGGIPVHRRATNYIGVDAVIDKDSTAQLIATGIGADTLAILTDVQGVYMRYPAHGAPIREISADELRAMAQGLEAGTMRPKAEACARFISAGGARACIGSLDELDDVLNGSKGTQIRSAALKR